MSTDSEYVKKLLELVNERLIKEDYPGDTEFNARRTELADLCKSYAKDFINPDFLDKGASLIGKFDSITANDSSNATYNRAKVNATLTASRVRRTHYAAYLAGKYSADKNIGGKFKCWMFNIAAFSAMQLRTAIASGIDLIEEGNEARPLLSTYANSAVSEVRTFLTMADEYDSTSALTLFNRACLEISIGKPNGVRHGIESIKSIPEPAIDCHAADLSWHINIYDSFIDNQLDIQNRIATENGYAAKQIEAILKRNSDVAKKIKDDRGDLWRDEKKHNKSLVTTAIFGAIVVGASFVSEEARSLIEEVIRNTGDLLASNMTGDGGIAQGNIKDIGMTLAQVSFGDGGIA